ncbi:recombinase family protein [Enterococcus mundtii]|nr:recombinase family protein [Enterococcus mundtii]
MDTSTPTGKVMLQMMSVIAELERNLLVVTESHRRS